MENDLIKMIPEMLTGEKLDNKLRIMPEYSADMRYESAAKRLLLLQDIYKVFIPNEMSREIYTKLYLALIRSLQKKNTIQAVRQYNQNYRCAAGDSYESIIGGSDAFTIVSPSGCGKSSCVSRAARIITDSVILCTNDTKIIPCLVIQVPGDSSVKGFLLETLRKTDEMLQTNYYKNALRAHLTVDMLIGVVSSVLMTHVGNLVLDEYQNTLLSKTGRTLLATVTQMINNAGVSICFVGTPEITGFFDQNMIMARRSIGLSYEAMSYDDNFRSICHVFLGYCYTKERQEPDESMYMYLYNHCGGNISVLVSLIHDAQELSILNGTDRLDTASLNVAYERRLTMLHEYIYLPETKRTYNKKKENKALPETNKSIRTDDISLTEIIRNAKAENLNILETVGMLKDSGIKIEEIII